MDLSSSIMLKAQLMQQKNVYSNCERKVTNQELSKKNSELHRVAEDFEAIFVKQMLDGMRKAELAKDPLNTEAVKTYNSLMDYELSKKIALSQGFGIAEALVNQLSPQEKVKR